MSQANLLYLHSLISALVIQNLVSNYNVLASSSSSLDWIKSNILASSKEMFSWGEAHIIPLIYDYEGHPASRMFRIV